MKPKDISKKLTLSKVTISTLNLPQMEKIEGGVNNTWTYCCTCNYSICVQVTVCTACAESYMTCAPDYYTNFANVTSCPQGDISVRKC